MQNKSFPAFCLTQLNITMVLIVRAVRVVFFIWIQPLKPCEICFISLPVYSAASGKLKWSGKRTVSGRAPDLVNSKINHIKSVKPLAHTC